VDDAELLAKKRAAQMRTKTSESVVGYQSYVFMGCRHFLEGERGEAYERFERAFEMETPDELLEGIVCLRREQLKPK
jgi:hypothetical protein